MKRLLTLIISLITLASFAQYPAMPVNVNGYVTVQGSNLAVEGHMVKITVYLVDSVFTSYERDVYTNANGWYTFNDTVIGTAGYLGVETEICDNQIQTENFDIGINLPNYFTVNFQICEDMGCQASFMYYHIGPNTYQFINNSTQSDGMTYYWSFGDGTQSWEQNPVKTYASAGLYEVLLSITSQDSSCTDYVVEDLYVEHDTIINCSASFYTVADSSNSLSINFQDISVGNMSSWSWDFGDGAFSYLQNPTHVYNEPGIYNVCLSIASPDSSCTDMACVTVYVGQSSQCVSQFTSYPAGPGTSMVIQFIDLSYGNIDNWYWTFGDGFTSTEQSPQHFYESAGSYYVCLTISGADCQSTWCNTITINDTIQECSNYFTYTAAGTSVQFHGFQNENPSNDYYWDFGDNNIDYGSIVTHNYNAPGIYFVTLRTISQLGCTAYSSANVVVGDTIAFNQVYGQIFEDNFPMSSGFVMIFSDESDTTWYPYFEMTPVDQSGIYVFSMVPNGTYKVMAIPTDGSTYLPTYYESTIFWQEATDVVANVTPNPVNIVLQNSQGSAPLGQGIISGQINLAGLRDGFLAKIVVYLTDADHNILDFTQVNDQGAFSFSNLAFGTYYIKPELSGIYSEYQLVTLSAQQSQAAIVMTFNGNSILGESEGIAMTSDVKIYPNPVNENARIIFKQSERSNVKVSLIAYSGKIVLEKSVTSNEGLNKVDLDFENLQPGIYLLRLQFKDGSEISKKVVKN
ncbi:MAG: PKD domain-containing protein [Omnitrophica WOR_2 bacterium]